MATKMNLCLLEAAGSIGPMISMPQARNVQGELIALSSEEEVESNHRALDIYDISAQSCYNHTL